jgi:hypothetical protein
MRREERGGAYARAKIKNKITVTARHMLAKTTKVTLWPAEHSRSRKDGNCSAYELCRPDRLKSSSLLSPTVP